MGRALPLGQVGLQPRWQSRHVAGQLWPAHRGVQLPGGHLGASGQHLPTARRFLPKVKRLREAFGIGRVAIVGDKGMISQKAGDELSQDSDLAH
ncbi:MAG: hypothetical protein LH481_07725 [Burkholderiales bacterium]|nr:hypothetical protein [Burkholderiales bacterium]